MLTATVLLPLILLASPPEAPNEEPEPEDKSKIEQLERRIQELESRLDPSTDQPSSPTRNHVAFTDGESPNDNGGKRPGYTFSPVGDLRKASFSLGGYFSLVYRDQFGPDRAIPSAFDNHRFILFFGFDIAERLSFSSEVEIEGGGADVPFLSGNEILVEFAELEFEILRAFRPKAGLMLIPFGRYNMYHDDPLHDLFDRPFVARRVIPSAFDQPGVGVTGDVTAQAGLSFNYHLALTQGFRDNFTSHGSRDARQSFRADENSNKAVWLRAGALLGLADLGIAEATTLEVNASYTTQTIGADDHRLNGMGFDFRLVWNSGGRFGIDLEGEYAQIEIERDPTVGITGLDGYYTQATFRFRPWDDGDAGGWLRDSGYIGLVARWEENDLDDRSLGASIRDDREAVTLGIAFRPFFKTVIRAEWKWINSRGLANDEPNRFVFGISTYF